MITIQEIELLAAIMQRAGVTQIEAMWLNGVFDKLRALAEEAKQPPKPKENDA